MATFHKKAASIEAEKVKPNMIGSTSNWPVWAANYVRVGSIVGNPASAYASMLDGTRIEVGDYIILNADDTVSLVRKAAFEAKYETAIQ